VREAAEGKPVQIGRLQRYATDAAMAAGRQFYDRAAPSGRRIAVVGAGPAGLACAHRLAVKGHDVTIFEARPKPGGLNEYGIAAYKATDDFAQAEVDYVTEVGGIVIDYDKALGRDVSLAELVAGYDAVFLGMGLAGVNALNAAGETAEGVDNAVDFIAELRQADDLASIPVGRRVVVIGGGMTAIDAAIQSKLLGAEEVTICYRRGQEDMNASRMEQELAASKGVLIRHWLQPRRIIEESGRLVAIEMEYTDMREGRLVGTGETVVIEADQVFKAIGQSFEPAPLNGSGNMIALERGRIRVDAEGRTSMAKVWAGGDCVADAREDLTVAAVAAGRDAAESIHRALTEGRI
jgi:glutamate synthase (NADPH/NADH) small chain